MKRYYAVEVEDYDEKEKLIHKIFSKSQVANSELFALDIDLAEEMLDSFNGKQIYPKVTDKEEEQEDCRKKRKTPKSNLTFAMLHIPIGSTLYWYKDDNITVTTVDDKNKVSYKGDVYSISKVVAVINGIISLVIKKIENKKILIALGVIFVVVLIVVSSSWVFFDFWK